MPKRKYIVNFLLANAFCMASVCVSAQNNLWSVFEKIKEANKGEAITYSYRVYMVNKASGVAEDSIKGSFFKSRYNYLDSNSTQLTAFDGQTYCKLDFVQQAATVYDVDYLTEKIGLAIDSSQQSIISIPDSIILKYGNVKLDFPKDRDVIIAHITFREQTYSDIAIELDKSSYRILTMRMETDMTERLHGDDYKKVYIMEDISHKVSAGIINLDRFLKVDNNSIELKNKYAKYKLTSLTN